VPTPTDPLRPDREPPAGSSARWTPVDQVPDGWVPDTVPVPATDPGVGPLPTPRATLTAMITPPHRGGVRRSGSRRGDASLATARLGSCRCPRHR
jgi:hypothetical protein